MSVVCESLGGVWMVGEGLGVYRGWFGYLVASECVYVL